MGETGELAPLPIAVIAGCTMVIERDSWYGRDDVMVRGCRMGVMQLCIEAWNVGKWFLAEVEANTR
jgi:hypothetical protein